MAELTFLLGVDPAGTTNPFYTLAKQYFADRGDVVDAPLAGQTLEGVFKKLTDLKVEQKTINLVSHATGFGSLQCPLTLAMQAKGRHSVIAADLEDALNNKTLAPPAAGVITTSTRLVIYGCDVGRSLNFLTLLSGVFGDPGEILAPRRIGIFVGGAKVDYRQAQTWSLTRKPPHVFGTAGAPAEGWPAYRTAFVADARTKFGRLAIPDEPVGQDRLLDLLKTTADNTTSALGKSFFIQEGFDIFPQGSQTAEQAAASVAPVSNGDPVTAVPKTALELDDTAVVTTITSADTYPANPSKTQYTVTVAILGRVVDEEVVIVDGPGYRRVSTGKARAPSPGPKPAGSGSGSGSGSAASAAIESISAELLALGAAQSDIDTLLADAPQGDALDGVETTSTEEISTDGDLDNPPPPREYA